jgi:hypothetical protein
MSDKEFEHKARPVGGQGIKDYPVHLMQPASIPKTPTQKTKTSYKTSLII